MTEFRSNTRICEIPEPLHWTAEKTSLLVEACREMALFHYKASADIRYLYDKEKFNPELISTEADLAKIPMVGVNAMKYLLLTSLDHEKAVLKLTSSGTRGQKTQIWFDVGSLARVQRMLDVLWEQEGLVSSRSTNYVNFIYDPEQAKDLGISFSVANEQRFAPANESVFVVKKNEAGVWEFKAGLAEEKLREFAKDSTRPVRILGIPSFMFECLMSLEGKEPIRLPEGSVMLTGGGWKAAEDKKVTRDEFRALVSERLGIPSDNIRDLYGMAEHSAPYIECRAHKFHVPVYNRVLIRCPSTMRVLPDGEMGLMEFITPFNAMMPTLAILSTDLGYLDVAPCACGWKSPTFTLVGRGGLTKHKGCALTASDLVKRK
jgi:hypothetical protein